MEKCVREKKNKGVALSVPCPLKAFAIHFFPFVLPFLLCTFRFPPSPPFTPTPPTTANAIPRNKPQFRAMLNQNIARTLRWIDSHAVVGYDRARLRWDSKLFCDILEDSSERGVLWHRNL